MSLLWPLVLLVSVGLGVIIAVLVEARRRDLRDREDRRLDEAYEEEAGRQLLQGDDESK